MPLIIEQFTREFCVGSNADLRDAVSRIDENKQGFVLCVHESGVLEGLLTDGDLRRQLLTKGSLDLQLPVRDIMRTDFVSAMRSQPSDAIEKLFTDKVHFVPLQDAQGRLCGLARKRKEQEGLHIADRVIGPGNPVFIIAEVGINHNGSLDTAKKLIDATAEADVDCVKFQMRNLDTLYRIQTCSAGQEDLGAQYTMNLLSRFELPVDDMLKLFEYSRSKGLIPLCTPWDLDSLAVLEKNGLEGYKVASADMTNHELLQEIGRTYRPVIVSTGMSTEEEIRESVQILQKAGAAYALLQCNSTYPSPFKDVHLHYMKRLAELGQCPVGYSGHERGSHVAVAAVALGAHLIEKHITLDRSMEGSDHKVSLLPDEFAEMVSRIRDVEDALGDGGSRSMSQGEMINRANLAKSLVASRTLKKGHSVQREDVLVRSPGRGLQPNRLQDLIGHRLLRDIDEGDFFYPSDLAREEIRARPYQFSRPWGVAVRWHDWKPILESSNPDFLEFHLSFKDMDENYLEHFSEPMDLGLTVHSPDIFHDDHLLDLSNENNEHRQRSIHELQRVIDITRGLKPFFTRWETPLIIASLGGFSIEGLLKPEDVQRRYAIMEESLQELDMEGVEVIGQTLPPFPWYFGGQMYLNLFVNPKDTAAFCEQNNLRICFDVCHSQLACNQFHWSFKELVETLAPHTAHLHIADAEGTDGEGLQIGEGTMDLPALKEQLDHLCPQASFIPEIWMGHKNNGEGFWKACEKLEEMGW